MNKRSALFKRLLFLLPFVFGAVGLSASGNTILDSLFGSVQMYFLNYGNEPANALTELARWTAPLATASGLVFMLSAMSGRLEAAFKTRFMDSVAVRGPEAEKKLLLRELGRRGIDGDGAFLPARRYILLGPQKENFSFYAAHEQELKKSEVYLRCEGLPGQSVSAPNLHLFQPAEIAARLFWKKACLYPVSCKAGHHLTIALIGCGQLGDDLLYWGLQHNIFDPDQKIIYRVFGKSPSFPDLYPQLARITDPIEVYADGWEKHLPLLETADLILLLPPCGEEMAQEVTAARLLSLLPGKMLSVLTETPDVIRMLDGQERLHIFDIYAETLRVSCILEDSLLDLAKRLNLRYAHLYNSVTETKENADREWAKLDAFTRYSNISSADYHDIRLQLLEAMNISPAASLTGTQLELLSELEHIRWTRYHWLNNWQFGIPDSGKAKDASLRIHIDLIPYMDLPDYEKQKDRDTVALMLDLE